MSRRLDLVKEAPGRGRKDQPEPDHSRPDTPPPTLLSQLEPEQLQREAAEKSHFAEFLDATQSLNAIHAPLVLTLFEQLWTVRLYKDRDLLNAAIRAMERALQGRDRGRGYTIRDLDALDEIWARIENLRAQRKEQSNREISRKNGRRNKREIIPRTTLISDWPGTPGANRRQRCRNLCISLGVDPGHAETVRRRVNQLEREGALTDPSKQKSVRAQEIKK